ncbi:DUF1674-domain-containing protein [Thozetella sp. PMI_491]|nr:DUF1674-domain-containing protein [Thozetella sp. PMI_491]
MAGIFARAVPIVRPLRPAPVALRLRSAYRLASSFENQPSPPRLPAEQQAEFERLQRAAEAELYSHTRIPAAETPASPLSTSRHVSTPQPEDQAAEANQSATATLSGGIRQGAPPEFTGEKNPKTGEIGGPKNEPLRWGSEGDWSYNGRVTDF